NAIPTEHYIENPAHRFWTVLWGDHEISTCALPQNSQRPVTNLPIDRSHRGTIPLFRHNKPGKLHSSGIDGDLARPRSNCVVSIERRVTRNYLVRCPGWSLTHLRQIGLGPQLRVAEP